MTKVEDTNTASQLQSSQLPKTPAAPAAATQTPNLSPATAAEVLKRLVQPVSDEPQTGTSAFNSLVLKSVVELQSFQLLDPDTQHLVSGLIDNSDLNQLNQQRPFDPIVVRSTAANVTKLIESAGFKNAPLAVRRELLNAQLGQVDNSFLVENLVEIIETQEFSPLDQRSQELIVRQVGLAVSSRMESSSDKAGQAKAKAAIDNIKELIKSAGFSDASAAVRAKMLDTVARARTDANFVNILIQVSGNSNRFGKLNESQKFAFIDRTKELFDQKWASRLFIDPLREKVIDPLREKVKDTLVERLLADSPTNSITKIVEEINKEIDKVLGGNQSRENNSGRNEIDNPRGMYDTR